jgi:hypothetical protein
MSGGAVAHPGGVTLSGRGTATVDGVVSPGEWAEAGVVAFPANMPEGGTAPATLRMMNDGVNLYVSLTVARVGGDQTIALAFDNDHDGSLTAEEGDDGLSFGAFTGGPGLNDNVRTSRPPCPAGFVCGLRDTEAGGTIDGTAALSVVGAETHFELFHPLNSADDLNDFSLAVGDTVGFGFQYSIFGPSGPVFTRPAGGFGPLVSDLVLLAPLDRTPPTLTVAAEPSVLWPPSRELVPITLSVEAFDAGGAVEVTLDAVTSSDPGAEEDIAGAELGTDDRSLLLRAERAGTGARRYTIVYRAIDLAGNETRAAVEVTVPHDRRGAIR